MEMTENKTDIFVDTVSGNEIGTPEPEKPELSEKVPEDTAGTTPETPFLPDTGQDAPEKEVSEKEETAYPDISGQLKEFMEGLDKPDRTDELLERLDSLTLLLTPEEETETEEQIIERSAVILPGYEEWPYPIYVTYGITTASGYSTYVSFDYGSPEDFKAGFEKMETDVIDGYLKSFYIRYVYGADESGNSSEFLYDSEAPIEIPEPEPVPDDTTAQDILAYLGSVDTTLSEMSASDMEFYQSVMEQQKELLELQSADVGATIILCIIIIAVLAEMTFTELFRRFK